MNDFLSIANNPNTPAPQLEDLVASTDDKEILKTIALNPNSPPKLLIELAADYLDEIANNPGLELIIVEQPDFIDRLYSNFAEKRFHGQLSLPKSFLIWGVDSSNSNCRMAVGMNKNTPKDLLKKLSQDPVTMVRAAVASNQNSPNSVLNELTKDSDLYVREIAKSSL